MSSNRIVFSTIVSEILSIAGGIFFAIPNINPTFRPQAIYFLIILCVSLLFNKKYVQWEAGLQEKSKKYFRQITWFPKIIAIIFIFLLWSVPLSFSYIPNWITNQTKNVLYTYNKNGQCYYFEAKYKNKQPTSQNDLFFQLTDTTIISVNQQHPSSIGVEARPVLVEVIGSPDNDLKIFGWIFIGTAIVFIAIIIPLFKEIGNLIKVGISSR